MTARVPAGTPEQAVWDLRAREDARASELAAQAYPPDGYGGRRLPGRASQVSDG
jgi:hypothetical protein